MSDWSFTELVSWELLGRAADTTALLTFVVAILIKSNTSRLVRQTLFLRDATRTEQELAKLQKQMVKVLGEPSPDVRQARLIARQCIAIVRNLKPIASRELKSSIERLKKLEQGLHEIDNSAEVKVVWQICEEIGVSVKEINLLARARQAGVAA